MNTPTTPSLDPATPQPAAAMTRLKIRTRLSVAERFRLRAGNSLEHDQFLLLADHQAYVDSQAQASALQRGPHGWTRRSILKTVRMGRFSSRRSICDYCERLWKVHFASVKPAIRGEV